MMPMILMKVKVVKNLRRWMLSLITMGNVNVKVKKQVRGEATRCCGSGGSGAGCGSGNWRDWGSRAGGLRRVERAGHGDGESYTDGKGKFMYRVIWSVGWGLINKHWRMRLEKGFGVWVLYFICFAVFLFTMYHRCRLSIESEARIIGGRIGREWFRAWL